MMDRGGHGNLQWAVLLMLVVALFAPGGAVGRRCIRSGLPGGLRRCSDWFCADADGRFHLAFETNTNWGDSANGVGTLLISPSGQWPSGAGAFLEQRDWCSPNAIPGLAVMPSGALEAVFGGSPRRRRPLGDRLTNGGASWSAPVDVGSGSMEFGDSNLTLQVSNGTPVFTAGCCGSIVIQQGFGTNSPTYQLTNSSDNAAGNTDSAVDAATGAVVASWDSNAGSGGIWFQQVAPTEGAAHKVPVPSEYGTGSRRSWEAATAVPPRPAPVPQTTRRPRKSGYLGMQAGRRAGSVRGLDADVSGVGTGPDGRNWVVWSGQINGQGTAAATRSNKAATRSSRSRGKRNWSYLFTLSGDGRLGPLDCSLGGTPAVKSGPAAGGIYDARILPSSRRPLRQEGLRWQVRAQGQGERCRRRRHRRKCIREEKKQDELERKAEFTIKPTSGDDVTVKIAHSGYQVLK